MVREGLAFDAEATQIDDAFDAGVGCGFGKNRGRLAIVFGEIAAAARHRMDEIIRDVDAFEGGSYTRPIEEVALGDIDA